MKMVDFHTLRMATYIACAGLLALHPAALGQNMKRAGQTSSEKPFIINMSVRGEYDDNVNTAADGREDAAWKTVLRPSVTFKYPMENTMIEAGYTFGFEQFFGREGDDDVDFSHTFDVLANHRVNSRMMLNLSNRFSYDQEDSLRDGAGFQRRVGGDRIRNDGGIRLSYDWTERVGTVTSYENVFLHYFDDPAAFTNNYIKHEVGQQVRFVATRTTTPFFNYVYETYDYDEIARDRDSHFALVGADHFILPEWLVSAQAGAEFTLYDNPVFDDSISPYASVRTIWNYDERSNVSGSYSYGTTTTDNGNFASSLAHTFNLTWEHYITEKFSAGLSTQYQLADFDTNQGFATATQNATEHTISAGINARYKFTDYLSADVGYRYTEVTSDFANREYDRNRVYFGVSGSY